MYVSDVASGKRGSQSCYCFYDFVPLYMIIHVLLGTLHFVYLNNL